MTDDRADAHLRPGRFRHFKGQLYDVVGTARHSESGEEFVVYRALYGDGGLWVRPRAMWDERIQRDGYDGPRFVPVEEEAPPGTR